MSCYKKGKACPFKTEKHDLGNGDYVIVRELASRDFLDFQAMTEAGDKIVFDMVAEQLARCLVNDEGDRLFDSAEDLKANFPVGLSTMWELRDVIDRLSSPKPRDEKKN